ncbi:MAG TPA: nuclear transport factor 2 family protein [Acidobacteriota bacterium]|jgi:ketosteroid isomerase-like protein
MKKRLGLLWLVFGLLGTVLSAEPVQKDAHASKKTQAAGQVDFKGLMRKTLAAWETLNPEKAAPFYAKDAGNVYFDLAPLKYTGWSEYAAGVVKVLADYSSGKFTVADDSKIHRSGNLTWGTTTWHCELTKNAGGVDKFDGRWTVVWEKRGNDWLIVHEHVSAPMP